MVKVTKNALFNWYDISALLSVSVAGAVYAARVDGINEEYAVLLLIWEQSKLPTGRLKHRGAVGFLNEVDKMVELQEKSEHVVKFIGSTVETSELPGQLKLM